MNPVRAQGILKQIGGQLCAAALICAAPGALPQMAAVYKHVDPSGNTLYTDHPDASSSALQESAADSETKRAPARPAVSSRRFALVNSNEAQRRLAQAQLKRKQGEAPLPREIVRSPAGTRVTYSYWQRQEKLRIEVEQAQRRINTLQRPQRASGVLAQAS